MSSRRSACIPLIFIIASTLLLCSLGTWQVQRLQWKNSLIAQIQKAQTEPALGSLPELHSEEAITAIAYHNVRLSGEFMHDKALHMVGRPKEAGLGSAHGFYILTPFKLEDDGRVILVNRGFSLLDKETKPQGVQVVEGVIRLPRGKRYFSPDNNAQKNVWFYEDLDAMAQGTGADLVPMIVEATGKGQKDVYPIPNDPKITLRNDHLYYAITWYSIAFIGVIMFIIYQRKPKQNNQQ